MRNNEDYQRDSQFKRQLHAFENRKKRNEIIRIRCTKETRTIFYAFKVDMGFPTYEDALRWLLANVPKGLRHVI